MITWVGESDLIVLFDERDYVKVRILALGGFETA